MVFIPILAVVLCSGWPRVTVVVEMDEASNHHPNASFQLRRESILALQTLQRGLQVPPAHGEVRVVAGLLDYAGSVRLI
jgi:hypothetical protein